MIAAERGDSDACRKLVEAFLPAIGDLARSFRNSRVERLELLQEGVAGLLVAARRYDTTLNTPFWAYASFWVRKAMQELVADLTRPVNTSRARYRTDHRGAQPCGRPDTGAARAPAGDRAQATQHAGTADRRG